MIEVIILGVLAVFFAWLESSGQFKHGLKISFGLIFIFLAIRYNYGNDYKSYLSLYDTITYSSSIDFNIEQGDSFIEAGWVLLNFIFKPLGFFVLIFFTSLLYCYSFYVFFKRYVPKEYYWLSILIFIFDPGFILIGLSAMRQTIAVIIALFSIKYIYEKKIIPFVILIFLASFFHKSVYFVLPLFLLGFSNWKISNKFSIPITILFILFLVNVNSIIPNTSNFIDLYFEKYQSYYENQNLNLESGSGLGIAYQAILFFLVMFFYNKQQNEHALIFRITMVYFFMIPIGMAIIIASRINFYFQPAILVAYPLILSSVKMKPLKIGLTFLIIAYLLSSFLKFLNDDIWKEAFSKYQTIFSSAQWY